MLREPLRAARGSMFHLPSWSVLIWKLECMVFLLVSGRMTISLGATFGFRTEVDQRELPLHRMFFA